MDSEIAFNMKKNGDIFQQQWEVMEEFKHKDDMIWFAFLNIYSGYAGENDLEGQGRSSRTSLEAVTYPRWKMMVA